MDIRQNTIFFRSEFSLSDWTGRDDTRRGKVEQVRETVPKAMSAPISTEPAVMHKSLSLLYLLPLVEAFSALLTLIPLFSVLFSGAPITKAMAERCHALAEESIDRYILPAIVVPKSRLMHAYRRFRSSFIR